MKWLLGLFSIFALLIAALAIAPSFFDWNKYKNPALAQIAEVTGHEVSIEGDVSLALLPSPRVYLENVSVKDPSDPKGERVMAAFDLLDVRVALLPLLKGQAVVNSINLEKPEIALFKDADGEFNFMTPKLKTLMDKGDAAQQRDKNSPFALSFESVSVSEGAFTFREAGQEAPLALKDINIDVKASSLEGPFDARGALRFNDKPVEFEAKTGVIDAALQSTSLNLRAALDGMRVQYAGVVGAGDAPEVQGEFELSIASLSEFMAQNAAETPANVKGALSIKGVLTANPSTVSLKNATLDLAGKTLAGQVEAGLKPISVKGAFSGQDILDLDTFMKGKKKTAAQPIDPAGLGALLPKTLEIPAVGDIDIALAAPGMIYNGQVLRDIDVKIQNTAKSFAGVANIGQLPGQGRAQIQGALSYAEKSVSSKTETEIYSDPVGAFEIKVEAQNLPVLVQAFAGRSDFPFIKDSRKGIFDIKGSLKPSGLYLEKAVANIGENAFSAKGSWEGQRDSKRSLLQASVVADQLDFDALSGESETNQSGDPLDALKTLVLPFDADIDVSVNQARLQGYDIKGAKFAAAIRPNRLKINALGADDFAGASFSVSGGIADLKALSGLDITTTFNLPDPYKVASALKIDSESWPKNLGSVKGNVAAKGSLSTLDVNSDIQALGAQIKASGQVADPLIALKLSGLSVNISHPNTSKAIASFAPDAPNFASLSKSMSFKASVSLGESITRVSAIDANIAGAALSGEIAFDGSKDKPVLQGALKIGDLVLKSGNAKATQGDSNSGSASSAGKWSKDAINTAFFHNFEVNLDIAANSIVYETWDLSKPSLKIVLQNGALDLRDLKAGLYDGQITSGIKLSSSSQSAPLSVNANADIQNINMGALVQALSGGRSLRAEGDVSFKFDVSSTGASQNAIINALNGSANLNGRNVVIQGFDLGAITNAVVNDNRESILAGLSSFRSGSTAFETVSGQYSITKGVVNIDTMSMDGTTASIVSKGSASLPAWTVNTTHTATIKGTDKLDPFTFSIRGPIDRPVSTFANIGSEIVRGYTQGLVRDQVQDVLKDTNIGKKLQEFGVFGGGQQQPQAPANDNTAPDAQPAAGEGTAPQQFTPEDAIGGLLKGLLDQ